MSLVDKLKTAGRIGLGILATALPMQRTDAGVIVSTQVYDSGTQNQANVVIPGENYDIQVIMNTTTSDISSKSFKFIQWQLVLPSGISVSAASPSSSTTFLTNDYFTGSTMESNGLLTKVNTDFTNINYRTAKLDFPNNRIGSVADYTFNINQSSGMVGQTSSFDFYKSDTGTYTNLIAGDTSGTNYKQLSGNLSVVNNSFTVKDHSLAYFNASSTGGINITPAGTPGNLIYNIDFGSVVQGNSLNLPVSVGNGTSSVRVGLDLDNIARSGTGFSDIFSTFTNLTQNNSPRSGDITFNTSGLDIGQYSKTITLNLSDSLSYRESSGSQTITLNVSGFVAPIVQAPQPHTLTVIVQKQVNGKWVDGKTPLTITYGENGASVKRAGTDDPNDTAIWTNGQKFVNTSLGELGIYTREAAFGDSFLTRDARPILNEDGKPNLSNILIEVYGHGDTSGEFQYAENLPMRLSFSTLSPEDKAFFSQFKIIQRAPSDYSADGRYDRNMEVIDPTGKNRDLHCLSTPETNQSSPYAILEGILNGDGYLYYTAQGNMNFWDGVEFDNVVGDWANFDIIPVIPDSSGKYLEGSPYSYGDTYYIESGEYTVVHEVTPEPATLALLGLGGLGLLLRRRK